MKISNLTAKTSIEIDENDILVIEDKEETKQTTIKDFREYLLRSGINKSTKILINEMMDNIIHSLEVSKFVISELFTYKVNTIINDAESGDIYITLMDTKNDTWLSAQDIGNLLLPNEEGICTRNLVVNVLISDICITSLNNSIYEVNEESEDIPDGIPEGNIGYIKAHFGGLTQNEIAGITYDNITITIEDTDTTVILPVEDRHSYEFITDPEFFSNNVSYVQDIE